MVLLCHTGSACFFALLVIFYEGKNAHHIRHILNEQVSHAPDLLESCINNNDDSGLRIHGTGKGIKEVLLYLRVLLFFDGATQLNKGIERPSQIRLALRT